VTTAEATLDGVDLDYPRSKHAQRTLAGKLPGDNAGHLFARIFRGPGQKVNLVPMEGDKVNRGHFKVLETEWRKAIGAGHEVAVEINLFYPADARRPQSLDVQYRYGETRNRVRIRNRSSQKGSS